MFFSVLNMIFHGQLIFYIGVLFASSICRHVSFLSLGKVFFFSLVEDLIYAIKLDFLLINRNNSKVATFHDIPCCLYIPLLCFNFLHVFLIVWSSSSSLSLSPDVLFLQGSFYSSDFRLSFLVELSIPLYFSLSSP